jgi:serpin B
MQTNFDAHIQALDFASPLAPQTINQWAGDNTNGKITEVIDQISDDAVMFLMNALYFKGIWTDQFKTENTYNSPFTLDDGSVISIPTMHGLIQAKAVYEESYHALELFYGRKNFSMIIVVPNAGLSAFLQNATPTIWDGITIALDDQVYTTDIDVSLPKFTFEYEKQLKEQLKTLGMTDAFDPMLADLSKISDADLFVSFVKQNTFVEVNEEGTEAAAVTTVGVDLTSIGEQTQFFVDKPFVFAIREQTTNTLLFVGQVVNPE